MMASEMVSYLSGALSGLALGMKSRTMVCTSAFALGATIQIHKFLLHT